MRRMVKLEQAHRILSLVMAIVMVITVVPLSVFATQLPSSCEWTTDIDKQSFVVGEKTEFFVTIKANDKMDTTVQGSIEFSDTSAFENLQYKVSEGDDWKNFVEPSVFTTEFTGTELTVWFQVTFTKADIYDVVVCFNTVDDSIELCSIKESIQVNGKSSVTTDIGDNSFAVDEPGAFSFTINPDNDDIGKSFIGAFVFSDADDAEIKLEYYQNPNGEEGRVLENGVFDSETDLTLSSDEATYNFKATFSKTGTYTLTLYIKKKNKDAETDDDNEVLCFTVATVKVKARAELSFTKESIEIKYSDVNAINDTLKDEVEGAEYTYSSDSEDVVTVNEFGVLTPGSIGTAEITVIREETEEYMSATASYTVTVVRGVQGELIWNTTVPDSIKWNDPEGFTNTVSGGSGDGSVTYTSSKTEVADVDPETGVLTLNKPGTVTITATKDGGDLYEEQTTSYTLIVVKADSEPIVFTEPHPNAIKVFETYTNAATGGYPDGKIQYASSNDNIATVDENGMVTAHKQGVVTITAELKGNDYYEDAPSVSYTLTIYRAPQKTPLVFEKGTEGQKIKFGEPYTNAVISGGDTAPVTYSSSDESIATVDSDTGAVTAQKAGTVKITATAPETDEYEAQTLSYDLVIELADQTVEFENGTTIIPAITYGDSYRNKAFAKTKITYTSSDDAVAEVDDEGNLIIHKAGTVTITATAEKTEQYDVASDSYKITINKAEQIITFEKGENPEAIFNENENKFSNPASSNATTGDEDDRKDIEITYSITSGTELIDMDTFDPSTGEFTITGTGTITVEVTFSANERYNEGTASYTLKVNKSAQKISFDKESYEMTNGDKSFVSPTITTIGAGTGTITYDIKENNGNIISEVNSATGELTFTNNTGYAVIRATKTGDENYEAATAEYRLAVKEWEPETDYFTLKGDTLNDSGWFNGNVSIAAKNGYQLSFKRINGEAEWLDEFTDVVTEDGIHNISFYVRSLETGYISSLQSVEIKKDTVDPTAQVNHEGLSGWDKFLSIITLGLWQPEEMSFTIDSGDATSGVAKVEYYVAEGTTDVMSENILDAVNKTQWQEYSKNISVASNKIFVVYAKVTDTAGHYVYATTNGIVFDRTAVPEENIVFDILTEDCSGFYNGNVKLDVRITDAQPSSGIGKVTYAVLNNGKQTQDGELFSFKNDNPKYSDLVFSWDSAAEGKTITVDAEKNNSDFVVVRITVSDNAGNESSKDISLKICTNKPTIDVSYVDDPEAIEIFENVAYYDTNRTAKIVITGRTSVFTASDAPVFVINETKGNTENGKTYQVVDWKTEEVSGNPDAATHTYLIKFNGSANYNFTVDYTDIFGNNLKHASDKFAVDHDLPTASITIDEDHTWTKLLEALTFGLWKNSEVTVKASASDATSPIRSIEYYKSNSDSIITTAELEKVTWTAFEEFKISSDEQFTVYLKVTDRAGHIEYICSDGYIVDMRESNVAITLDEPNENGIYGNDFNVRFDVEDIAPYSGIRTVEYWVTCDGVETIHKTLYSFEYTRDDGDNSNGGHLTVKELDENGELAAVINKENHVPAQSDLKASFNKTITIDSKANNSDHVFVYVKAVDNAGNENTVMSEELKVDVVAPKISVSFDVNNVNIADGRGYLKTNRIATIVYTERTSSFDMEKATAGILFSGVDSEGNEVTLDPSEMIKWGDTVEVDGDPDGATHTAYVYFTTDANYDFTMSYTNRAGHACEYEQVVFEDGTQAPRYFTVDKENPTASISVAEHNWDKLIEILTFGLFSNKSITVTAAAEDATSPLTIQYYKTNNVGRLEKKDLDAVTPSDWKTYSEIRVTTDDRFVVYLKVEDYAGNYIYISTDGYIVDMTDADVTLTPDRTNMYHGSIPLYSKDVNVLIDVKEKKDQTYSGINKVEYWVMCDGKETQREVLYSFDKASPVYADLLSSFSRTVTIQSIKNNSCNVVLYAGVTDNAGNYTEKNVAVDIDVTAPTISVSYDNNSAYKVADNKGYFPAARSATIVITERAAHFDAVKATESIRITAVNANGGVVVSNSSSLISGWSTQGTDNNATHTATVNFSADANYTFSLSYTDLAENSSSGVNTGNSTTPYEFAVDTTAPSGTVTVSGFGTWDKLIEILTFGLWSKNTVEVTATSSDTTTPIESVTYYKTSDTTVKTATELTAVSAWTVFDGLSIRTDERFVVYVRITDSAGNTTYISTDGVIVDATEPDVETVQPEITITPEPTYGIYNSDVTVAVSVADPMVGETEAYSGLKEIRYEVLNMGDITQSGILYSFNVNDPTYAQLLQAWNKSDAIVVNKNLNNSNDVRIVVYAVDNVGNTGQAECSISIDITPPQINVTYDNNNGDTSFAESVYFNADRTARIVVTERNFDPEMVELTITNTDGYIPEISGWTTDAGNGNGDGTTHTAYVVFDRDGDYTFDISCTDSAENASVETDYENSLAPVEFTVDKTLPVLNIVYDNNEVLNGNYYKAQRTATITVTEHNFETSRINVSLTATDDGVQAALPLVSDWVSGGEDVHTATITYEADSLYQFDFDYNDKAGNATTDIDQQTFYVDKTNPSLTIEKIVDESANNDKGNIGFVITATDTNFDIFTPVLTAVTRKDNTFETRQLDIGSMADIRNGKVFTVTNIDADGIYRITCTVVDKAGNAYSEVTLEKTDGSKYVEQRSDNDTLVTFSVNRDGSTFEVDENTINIVDRYYIQNVRNDVSIIEINADPLKESAVTLNGRTIVKDADYTVTEEGGNGGWLKYTYRVSRELFAEEGEYTLVVSSRDKADNDAFSDVKNATVSFVVDRTAPVVTVSGLANGSRYQTDSQIVTLIPTDDGGKLQSLIVRLVSDDNSVLRELVNLSGEAFETELDNNGGKVTFGISEGLYQNVQIICTDCAAGDTEETNIFDTIFTNVSVSSSAFMIFWANTPLRWGVIGGTTAVAAGSTTLVIRRRIKKRKLV